MTNSTQTQSWLSAFKTAYLNRQALSLLALGISAGIPLALIFGTLSLWLREAGIDRSTVTMFGWAALGYSFKFIWAPLIDSLPFPYLTNKLGRRRGWLLVTQIAIVIAILGMASTNPSGGSLVMMAMMAVLLGFSSASQDIVIDAYRIECADTSLQPALSASYIAGYRIGMIISGAGALFLASHFGSTEAQYSYTAWQMTYFVMAAAMGIGIITTFLIKEPDIHIQKSPQKPNYGRLVLVFFISVIAFVLAFIAVGKGLPKFDSPVLAFLAQTLRFVASGAAAVAVGFGLVKAGVVSKQLAYDTWGSPLVDFFHRYGKKALLILALIGLYRISDLVAGMIANVFYKDMGFTKEQIAAVVKTYGLFATIFGGFIGGLLAQKVKIMHAMAIGAILAASTNLLFIWLFNSPTLSTMYLAVIFDNLASGLASAIFVAFLSALTSIRFTAVQYAIFSSLMTLFPKVLGGYSGAIVDNTSYPFFFSFTFFIGLPILILVYLVNKHIQIGEVPKPD